MEKVSEGPGKVAEAHCSLFGGPLVFSVGFGLRGGCKRIRTYLVSARFRELSGTWWWLMIS